MIYVLYFNWLWGFKPIKDRTQKQESTKISYAPVLFCFFKEISLKCTNKKNDKN